MGRVRESSTSLPPRMHKKGSSYYHVTSDELRKWTPLGSDFIKALEQWTTIENAEDIAAETVCHSLVGILYTRSKASAKRRKISHKLSKDDIRALVDRSGFKCAITGIEFDMKPSATPRNPWAPSLDRIDSGLPYSFANCRLVCLAVNYALNEWGYSVLKRISQAVAENNCRRL